MSINNELITNLVASNTDNAVQGIVLDVRAMSETYGWSAEEIMAVGDLVCKHRRIAVEGALEVAMISLRDSLSAMKERP